MALKELVDDTAVEFDNRRWEAELRGVAWLKQCRFPASSEIELGGTREQATITMKEKGLNENMQTDGAAFESWALALLLHCGVQSVRISMDTGAMPEGPHYERFLYRLKRFSELYPDRVTATWPDSSSKALSSEIKRFLNQPNPRPKVTADDSRERMRAAAEPAPSETALELALEISEAFRSHFELGKVMRQWPVGLFKESVAKGKQIFTGGKSGIDLIGIRNDTLVLFELKKSGNQKAGAVSELLFYANVMRDAIGTSAIFKFESREAKENCKISPEDILRCSNIEAVLLAPKFHPLITEPRIFEELNEAAMKRFGSDRSICFKTTTFNCPLDEYGDFKFSNGKSNE
jgi:hypothetical protein